MKKNNKQRQFTEKLLDWNRNDNRRQMPWKGEKNPYKIWLSEIILQQTRVEQGMEYYNRFVKAFPTVNDLAKADETKVFKLWEGLGYYSRCKNLIASAKHISNHLDGQFPSKYEDILQLKGIGPYTAAAISSFANNLPHAVLDGNVFRVLSRYFAIETAIDSNEGRKMFSQLATELLDKKQPAHYNQALMDFGATICKPKLPLCSSCVLQKNCMAYQQKLVSILPRKEKKIAIKTRWFYYFIASYEQKIYVKKRAANDIWENLYEFILIENTEPLSLENIPQLQVVKAAFGKTTFEVLQVSPVHKQALTHQRIFGQFIKIKLKKPLANVGFEAVDETMLEDLPFPKFITHYLKDKNVSLNLF